MNHETPGISRDDRLKEEAISLVVDEGLAISVAAEKLKVGSRSVYNWVKGVKSNNRNVGGAAAYLHLLKEFERVKAERDLLYGLILKLKIDAGEFIPDDDNLSEGE